VKLLKYQQLFKNMSENIDNLENIPLDYLTILKTLVSSKIIIHT